MSSDNENRYDIIASLLNKVNNLNSQIEIYKKQENIIDDLNRKKFEDYREEIESKYLIKKADLENKIDEINKERLRFKDEYQQSLQDNAQSFVEETVDELRKKEKSLFNTSKVWSFFGALMLIVGLVFFSVETYMQGIAINKVLSWQEIIFISTRGVIILTIIGFFVRYSFSHSGNYMRESIKYSNRMHAIKFGQFYIKTYGASGDWSEVKEAFSNWNENKTEKWMKKIKYEELNNYISSFSELVDKIKK